MTAEINDGRKDITIAEVEGFLGTVDSCVERLLRAARQLPEVDEDGYSECSFAEQLYAEKEEAQRDAAICFEKLGEYLEWVNDQINRCKKNYEVVSSHREQLNTDMAIERFSEAEVKLDAFYKKLTKLRGEIAEAMKKIDEALQGSIGKRFPGKIPQKRPSFSVPLSGSLMPGNNYTQSNSGGADGHLREMLSLGPIQ